MTQSSPNTCNQNLAETHWILLLSSHDRNSLTISNEQYLLASFTLGEVKKINWDDESYQWTLNNPVKKWRIDFAFFHALKHFVIHTFLKCGGSWLIIQIKWSFVCDKFMINDPSDSILCFHTVHKKSDWPVQSIFIFLMFTVVNINNIQLIYPLGKPFQSMIFARLIGISWCV